MPRTTYPPVPEGPLIPRSSRLPSSYTWCTHRATLSDVFLSNAYTTTVRRRSGLLEVCQSFQTYVSYPGSCEVHIMKWRGSIFSSRNSTIPALPRKPTLSSNWMPDIFYDAKDIIRLTIALKTWMLACKLSQPWKQWDVNGGARPSLNSVLFTGHSPRVRSLELAFICFW